MSGLANYELLVALVAIVLVLEAIAHWAKLPHAAVLIVGGAAVAFVPGMPPITPDPELVLAIFLPPLLMSGAYFTIWRDFRENMIGIILLAVGAVGFTTLVVGLGLHAALPTLPWGVCFAVGAIVSPPDAVAAEAVLAKVRLPGWVTTLLQGESLVNDAAGLVLLRFAVASALTGTFSLSQAIGQFAELSIGGVVFGLVIGQAGLFVIRRLHQPPHAIAATLVSTVVSYIAAERLGVSGVLSTVASGMSFGLHQHRAISATVRIRANAFWETMVFVLESLLFVLIGLSLRGVVDRVRDGADALHTLLLPALAVVLATIVARFVWVFASEGVLLGLRAAGRVHKRPPSLRAATVMSWAGMRGVVTLLAALSLPESLPGRDMALVAAFAVIVVSVLVQGSTLGPLIRWLKLDSVAETRARTEAESRAWVTLTQAQYAAIEPLAEQHPRLAEQFGYRARLMERIKDDMASTRPYEIAHFEALLRANNAGRDAILRMHSQGTLPDSVLRTMEFELDLQQMVAEARIAERE